MRQWLSTTGFCLTLALFWAGAELSSSAQSASPRRGTPLQFSGRPDATNSFNENSDRREEIQNLEDGLFGLSKPLTPGSSMQGVAPTITIRRAAPSKEMRELLDRRRNWMFASPESLPGGPNTSEQPSSLEELQKAGKLTAVEQYYLEMSRSQKNTSKGTDLASSGNQDRANDSSKLPPGIREREDELKRLLNSESELDNSADRSLEPLTSTLNQAKPSAGYSPSVLPLSLQNANNNKETPVEQYRQLLGLPSPALAVADIFKAPSALQEREPSLRVPTAQTVSTPMVLPGASRSLTGAQPGLAPVAPTAAEPPHPTIPGDSANSLTKPETPQRLTPPTPNFTAPRRMF